MACLIVALAQSTHTIDKQNRKEKKYFIQLLPSPLLPVLAAAVAATAEHSVGATYQLCSHRHRRREGWLVGGWVLEAED